MTIQEQAKATEEKIKELQSKGIPVYSISRIDLFNDCQYSYYRRYVKKPRDKPRDNVYNLTGSVLHETLEKLCKGQPVNATEELNNILETCEVANINFPTENAKIRWEKNIRHFIETFKVPPWKMLNEIPILYQVKGHYIQGKIDLPVENDDKTFDIYDWKSSSKFDKEDLLHKGRQFVGYRRGWESMGYTVDKTGWYMMKYIYVCYTQKNGKVKKCMCERGYWVKDMESNIKSELKKLGFDEIDIIFSMEEAIKNNSLDALPESVKSKYWTEPCIIYYDITPELNQEFDEYITSTIEQIEAKGKNESEWIPKQINSKNSFSCEQLSNYRNDCPHLQFYLNNKDILNKLDDDEDDLDSIL